MEVKIPHSLGKEESISRIKLFLNNAGEDYKDQISNLKQDWQNDKASVSFTAMGFDISSEIIFNESDLIIKGNLPFTLKFFKGKIQNTIKTEAEKILS